MEIKVGDKIRIKGDYDDFTDHLDGQVLKVIATNEQPGRYLINNESVVVEDNEGNNWYIWIQNILEVVK